MDLIPLIFIIYISIIVCLYLHIILHELGHLIFGLIENYRFFIFGIGSHAFIKEDGKIGLKKYKIVGTLAYVMMKPPKLKNHKIPYFWKLSGGIILNISSAIIVLLIINYIPLNEIIYIFLIVYIVIGFYLGIFNALPLRSSIGTDGCKILAIYKNKQAREYLYNLYMGELNYSKDVQIKDNSQTILNLPKDANLNNPILAAIKNLEADRYYSNMEYEKAEESYKSLISDDVKLTKVQKNEVLCQILYFEIIKGNKEEVGKLMTKKLKKYIKSTYSNISKKRLMYAYTVLIEKDVEKSEKIWHDFHNSTEDSLMKSQIETESEMMDHIGELGIEKGIL